MTKIDDELDEEFDPMVDEEPPRSSLRRLVRWAVLVSVATVGIMAVLTILMPEPV
jgi:hypothetical protein